MPTQKKTTALYHPKHWPMWLLVGFLQLLVLLPHGLLIRLGKGLGHIVLKFAGRRRHIAAANIKLCFPHLSEQEQQQLLTKIFEENCAGYLEAFSAWLKPGAIANIHVNGLENLKALQRDPKGVILIGAHYTTIDIAARLTGQTLKLNGIYRPQNNAVVNHVMERGRSRFLESELINQHDFRGMVKCLKQGRTLWFPADQDHGAKNSVFAPFFGVNAATLDMPTRLAKLTGANVVFASYFRRPDNSYEVTFTHLNEFTGTDKLADAILLNRTLEKSLEQYPAQYMWVHRRFKTRPEGEPSVY